MHWPRWGNSLSICILVLLALQASAEPERGLPFVSWYSPQDYGAGTQNWAIAQGHDDIMYFGNDSVVLVFDGARWSQVRVAPGRAVRSLAVAGDGRILVGSQGEFGYLVEDAYGELRYQSLLPELPAEAPEFSDVWQILVNDSGWYFSTSQALFHFSDDEIRIIDHGATPAGGSFQVNDHIFTDFLHLGIQALIDGHYQHLPVAFQRRSTYAMLPMADERILIGTRQQGLFALDPADWSLTPVAESAGQYLTEHHLYHGTVLPDGRHAFATLRGGLVLVDVANDRVEVINRERGLPDNRLRHLFVDAEGGLWIALDSGIARLEPRSMIAQWDRRTGLDGAVLSMIHHMGKFYAGTTLGLFELIDGHFEPVFGIDSEVWELKSWTLSNGDELLLAATSYGVFLIEGDTASRITEPYLSMSLAADPGQPGRVWVASYDMGLGFFDLDQRAESASTTFIDVQATGRRVEVDHLGMLWLETWLDGLLRIDTTTREVVWQFPESGSMEDKASLSFLINERVQLISSRKRIWQWLEDGRVIPREDLRNSLLEPMTGSVRLVEGHPNEVWSISTDGLSHRLRVARIDEPGHQHPIDGLLGRLPDVEFYHIYPDDQDRVWLAGSDALYRVDLLGQPNLGDRFGVQWRDIRAGERALPRTPTAPQVLAGQTDFPLRFRFSAPSFDWPAGTSYRYRLLPEQIEWSAWQSSAEREFTHLPSGDYRFEVQARDSYGRIQTTPAYAFMIPPPWYLSPLFLIATLLLLLAMIPTLLWLGGHRQARRSRQLESMVAERTNQLHQQQKLLEQERDKLEHLSQHDELTGLPNRRQGNRRLKESWKSFANSRHGLAIALIDIDHFKQINDQLGHDAGDRVLIEIAGILKASLRPEDTVARWGGEEFLLLFPQTSLPDAAAVCHRINESISTHDWSEMAEDLAVTASSGVTASRGDRSAPEMLIRADELLYQAKRRGRNRVEVERETW
jgi:diguanylate cyclase (GGDEF)-like protein